MVELNVRNKIEAENAIKKEKTRKKRPKSELSFLDQAGMKFRAVGCCIVVFLAATVKFKER